MDDHSIYRTETPAFLAQALGAAIGDDPAGEPDYFVRGE